MLLTIGEIIRRFRTEGACIKFSPKTITHMADVIGYHIQRRGGKVGYDQSLITAITQRFREAVEYEKSLKVKQPQKPLKQPNMGNYYTYNGERDNIDYDWEKNENRIMKQAIRLTEEELRNIVKESVKRILENELGEINHLAEKSNVTICSLEDFKSLVYSLGIDDNNVDQYAGQYCFIEIGSSYARIAVEKEYSNVNMINGQEYSPKDFYKNEQWYFKAEHSNVIKLEFDDNQEINQSTPNQGKDPSWKPKYGENNTTYKNNLKNVKATAVALRKHEVKPEVWDKLGFKDKAKKVFYYTHGKGVDDEMINRLKNFVDKNLALNPNMKFIVHCRAGQSRSAAVGVYLAKKIGQYTDDFLSEYADQIKMPTMKDDGKRSKRYPHQNMLNGLSRAEGWEDLTGKRQARNASDRWWYPQMINYLEKNGK